MSVDISALVTMNWPQTEAKLTGNATVDYATQKAAAIARAKVDAYGNVTVPAEPSIPDRVAYWIADKATLYLIPLAKEYYSIQEQKGTSREGANVTHYDKLAMLEGLRRELEQACASSLDDIEDLVGRSDAADSIPDVSYDGMLVEPVARARDRGEF